MESNLKYSLNVCSKIYQLYIRVIESYVSDFYVDNHWNKLTENWQTFFGTTSMGNIGDLLDFNKPLNRVHPLALICLKHLITNHMIPRKKIDLVEINPFDNSNFMKFFWKNVKQKKRHEINIMSNVCYNTASEINCFYIVDIGSGLGHLSRMLSYGYGFKVCTFEANEALVKLATELDVQFERILNAKSIQHKCDRRNNHINRKIETDIDSKTFLKLVLQGFGETDVNLRFGIVGLHPCGDLGATLLRLYNECANVAFINIVSCCYMKLSLSPSIKLGFPLSDYSINNKLNLSYLSCEIACHAIEKYVDKLATNDCCELKIHAYRAGLEKILIGVEPHLKHSQLCSVKYEQDLTFSNYCKKALKKLNITLPVKDIELYEDIISKSWNKVVTFYSIRLFFAPIIETIILIDRLFYVEQNGSECNILPVFDSKISPRNHVLSAKKKCK